MVSHFEDVASDEAGICGSPVGVVALGGARPGVGRLVGCGLGASGGDARGGRCGVDDVASLTEELARLHLESAEERRRREAAEGEAAELRHRLKLASDEARLWRERYEQVLELEAGRRLCEPRQRNDGKAATSAAHGEGEDEEDDDCDGELADLEGAVDALCAQRAALDGDLEKVRRHLFGILGA